jgi:glycosyltransferase involved in cell wall biosynthesis
MSDRPTLAMLIPAYNAGPYLPRLLDSAARQTQPFDEIWVYDDCSIDETVAVAERYGARIVRGDVNRGCSHGKNRLAAATGCDWIHFHDADDELMPNFVERAREWMAEDQFDVVLFPYEERDDRSGSSMGIRWFEPESVKADPKGYAVRNQINPFCGLYRREAFLGAGTMKIRWCSSTKM